MKPLQTLGGSILPRVALRTAKSFTKQVDEGLRTGRWSIGQRADPARALDAPHWIEGNGRRFLDPLSRTGCQLQYGPQECEIAIGGSARSLRCLGLTNRLNLVPRDRMKLPVAEVRTEPLKLDLIFARGCFVGLLRAPKLSNGTRSRRRDNSKPSDFSIPSQARNRSCARSTPAPWEGPSCHWAESASRIAQSDGSAAKAELRHSGGRSR